MKLKDGVRMSGVQQETVVAMMIANHVFIQQKKTQMVITSVMDGKHMPNSLHYTGFAFDIRTRDLIVRDILTHVKEIRAALGKEYDVVLESDHIHIEYDPK